MKTLHRRCAGLDVHSDSVVACARLTVGTKTSHEVRRFSTATRDLLELADWLAQGITHVAMEATGVYWKPMWHILEGRFELVLANAAHIRNVPGRKSDVNDAVWISDLLAHGLIQASFVPPAQIQDVRDLTRTRTQLAREVAQHVQRIQKTLENANIKLTSVISDIVGMSGRRILKAMIAGETNPAKLADLGSKRLKCPRAELTAALEGRVTAHHRFLDCPSSSPDRRTGAAHRSLRCADRGAVGAPSRCGCTAHYNPRCKPSIGASHSGRDRSRYDAVSDIRASVVLGWPGAQARRERRQAAINARSKGGALVKARLSPMCLGRSTFQGYLLSGAVLPPQSSTRTKKGCHRSGGHAPDCGLPHAEKWHVPPRPRPRLFCQTRQGSYRYQAC
jgi:transposase